jgi:hypothetical protein
VLKLQYLRGHRKSLAKWFEGGGFSIIGLQSPTAYLHLFARPIGDVGPEFEDDRYTILEVSIGKKSE